MKEENDEDHIPRDLPTCHFIKPSEANNIFLLMEKDKTCFMMIKSNNLLDFHAAIKASIWSSTERGNDALQKAYNHFVVNKGGTVYLFFSANGSGHISAFGQLVSGMKSNKDLPDIWLEKDRYTGCFMIRFILVKEIPMNSFSNFRNKDGKELRRCRDTDRIGFKVGLFMAKTCFEHVTANSLLNDLTIEVF